MRFVPVLLALLGACATKAAPVTDLAPPDFAQPASGSSAGPSLGAVATLTIKADTPSPRCLRMLAAQKLRVVNQIKAPTRVRVGGISFNVPAGKATLTDDGIGRYLALGGHFVSISSYSGNAELVVVR